MESSGKKKGCTIAVFILVFLTYMFVTFSPTWRDISTFSNEDIRVEVGNKILTVFYTFYDN